MLLKSWTRTGQPKQCSTVVNDIVNYKYFIFLCHDFVLKYETLIFGFSYSRNCVSFVLSNNVFC